jgi:hypothetical protein
MSRLFHKMLYGGRGLKSTFFNVSIGNVIYNVKEFYVIWIVDCEQI